jgi:hypothetical protein
MQKKIKKKTFSAHCKNTILLITVILKNRFLRYIKCLENTLEYFLKKAMLRLIIECCRTLYNSFQLF